MKKLLLLLLFSLCLSQVTLTDEEAIELANNIQELQIQLDSLTTLDSLNIIEITLLNEKIDLLERENILLEKNAKLVKPSWYENKWLYFGYGATLGASITLLVNQLSDVINIF